MARVTQQAVLAAQQAANQPALLDDSAFPVCLPVLEAVRAKRYEFTGARLLDDDLKALRLVELLVARWGVRKISRKMHISPHTVRAARRELTRQGKLASYVQRVVESMEDAIEAGINNYRDALEDGRINPTQIPVGLGIIFDKRQLATNQATSISTRLEVGDGLKVEDLNAYLETLPNAKTVPATDSASTETPAFPLQTGSERTADVTLDVTGHPPDGRTGPEPAMPSTQLDGRPATDPAAPQARTGGGGDADAGSAD